MSLHDTTDSGQESNRDISGSFGISKRKHDNTQSQVAEISEDERRVFRECNRESFWYRCVPIGGSLMAATMYATSMGYIKPHPKYGSTLKLLGAGLVGLFIGKISYWQTCQNKILALPNSKLADHIRQRQRGRQPSFESQSVSQTPDDYHMSPSTIQRDVDSQGRDYDTHTSNQNEPVGLDDSLRPSLDSNETLASHPSSIDETSKPQLQTSYDELRKKNRDDSSRASPDQSRASPGQPHAPQQDFSRRPWTQPQPLGQDGRSARKPDPPKPKSKTNKYGDEME